MINSKICIKTERDVETTLGIKKEKIDSVQMPAASIQKPITKPNIQTLTEEKRNLIQKIGSLQSENQRTVLQLKAKEVKYTEQTLEKQNIQQNFSDQMSSLSNENSSLRSELLNAKNELIALKNESERKISDLNSENLKMRAVIKQLKSAKSNASRSDYDDSVDDIYEVEKLLAHKNKKDGVYYLVRWKNYTAAHDTWQKESDLQCPKILDEYKRTMKMKMNRK